MGSQKTEFCVCRWLPALVMFDITRFYRICQRIGCYLKSSVGKIILPPLLTPCSWQAQAVPEGEVTSSNDSPEKNK